MQKQEALIPHPGFLGITERDEKHVYRQGDVLLIPIPAREIPLGAIRQQGLLLRRGEHNGRHAVAKGEEQAEVWKVGQQKFVRARRGARIVHGEHGQIDLPPGFYFVRVQREADERTGQVRYVDD